MIIKLRDYLNDYIGDISWYGETNHDDKSKENMNKAYEVLYFLENVKADIISELEQHRSYRDGNASAIMLHNRAKEICERFDDAFEEERWLD